MLGSKSKRKKAIKTVSSLDCDYEMARVVIGKKFGGSVIRDELARLLTAFDNNPCEETAVDLVLYDKRYLAFFQLARGDGFATFLHQQSKDEK